MSAMDAESNPFADILELRSKAVASQPVSSLMPATDAATDNRSNLLVPAVAVGMENTKFLSEPEIPLGVLTIVAGVGGLGKSHYAIEVAARASRGQLRGDLYGKPVDVVIATLEDGLATTVKPRLAAAGADMRHVLFVSLDVGFAIPDDLPRLEAELDRKAVRLIVLDPLIGYIPLRLDGHKDQHARAALAPLAALAQRHDAAVLGVMHLNKDADASALFLRVSSSIGFLNAARSALLVAPDLDDERCRVLAHGKHNLSEPADSRRFRIEGVEIARGDGEPIRTSRIAWLGSSAHSVADLLAARDPEERALWEEAAGLMRDALAAGPRPARDVERELRDALGPLSAGIVYKARQRAGIATEKDAFGGGWTWSLAEGSREGSRPYPPTRESSSPPAEMGRSGPQGSRSNVDGAIPMLGAAEPGEAAALPERLPNDEELGGARRAPTTEAVGEHPWNPCPECCPRCGLHDGHLRSCSAGRSANTEPAGWRRLQREAGEGPETDDAAAPARVKEMLGATEAGVGQEEPR